MNNDIKECIKIVKNLYATEKINEKTFKFFMKILAAQQVSLYLEKHLTKLNKQIERLF